MSHSKFSGFIYFLFGSLFLVTGVVMIIFDIQKLGRHYLTQQQSAIGGLFVIFVSLGLFLVGYFALSPFSKLREFIEGTANRRKD